MKQKNILPSSETYAFFVDRLAPEDLFAIHKSNINEKNQILEAFDGREENVPDEYVVEVTPMKYVGKYNDHIDNYDLCDYNIKLPINRIQWIFVKIK